MSGIDQREMGEYPVSPGTSKAVQGLQANSSTVKADWLINVRTVLRNIISSVPTEYQHDLHPIDVSKAFERELVIIQELVRDHVPTINVRFYYPTYQGFVRMYKNALHKTPSNENQIAYAKLEQKVYEASIPRFPNIEKVDCKLPYITNNAYITTHFPADLLTKSGIGELTLVESHTGTFKRKSLWSSKLTGNDRPEVASLPFNRLTIQVFGDCSIQFKSSPLKMKRMLLDMAASSKWNTLTPDERVRFSVNQLRDPFAKRFFLDMLN